MKSTLKGVNVLKNIVEFKEVFGNQFPSMQSMISQNEDRNKALIVAYLKNGKRTAESPSRPIDFVTGKPLNMSLSMQSDGEYTWRSDFVYYYEKYNLKLNPDFISHVLNMQEKCNE